MAGCREIGKKDRRQVGRQVGRVGWKGRLKVERLVGGIFEGVRG